MSDSKINDGDWNILKAPDEEYEKIPVSHFFEPDDITYQAAFDMLTQFNPDCDACIGGRIDTFDWLIVPADEVDDMKKVTELALKEVTSSGITPDFIQSKLSSKTDMEPQSRSDDSMSQRLVLALVNSEQTEMEDDSIEYKIISKPVSYGVFTVAGSIDKDENIYLHIGMDLLFTPRKHSGHRYASILACGTAYMISQEVQNLAIRNSKLNGVLDVLISTQVLENDASRPIAERFKDCFDFLYNGIEENLKDEFEFNGEPANLTVRPSDIDIDA